jgi:hypothetical protein
MFQELNKKEKTNKGRITMRRSIYLFAMLSLFVIGCSEQSSVLAPVNNVNTTEPNWIALPQAEGIQINTEWPISKKITGSVGGYIGKSVSYTGTSGKITVQARIDFEAGAFEGSQTITMTLSDQNTSVTFSPSMVFLKAATYNVTYTGINLSGINPSTVKFAYLAADGSVQYAANDGVSVDLATGTLKVSKAKIPHFSRYGFVN